MKQVKNKIKLTKDVFFLFLKVVFVLIVLAIFYRLFFVIDDYWSGVYYPKGNANGSAIYSPHYASKKECVGWAINERGLHPDDVGVPLEDLWECNKNCQLSPSYTILLDATQQYKQELIDENMGPTYICDDGGFDGGDWLRGEIVAD